MFKNLKIEPAVVDDVPDLLRFIRLLAEYERLSHEVSASEDGLRATLFGDQPAAEVVWAKREGVKVGFALFFTSYSTFLGRPGLYLEDLFVLPEARGQGVGYALLKHLSDLAIQRGYGRMEWSVLDWNTPAIEFYHRLGAAPMQDWTVFRLSGERMRLK